MPAVGRTKANEPNSQDEVWLMDNTAFRSSPASGWRAEYVLAFFKDNTKIREKITDGVAALSQTLKLAPNDKVTDERLKERITPFIRNIGRHMEVDIQYQEGGKLHIGPSDSSGIIAAEVPVPVEAEVVPGDSRKMSIIRPERELPLGLATSRLEAGKTFFAQDGGWGVISDIDDTIKITEVRDRIKLLKNTFVRVPVPVPDMPQLYKQLHETLSTRTHPAPFIYLSASPYNLYPMLRTFLKDTAFPQGQIVLRDMSWMDM
jgi:hypothetical protein